MELPALLNALPQACLLVDPQSKRITHANTDACNLLGVSSLELEQTFLSEHVQMPRAGQAINFWRKGTTWLNVTEEQITLNNETHILFVLKKVDAHIDPVWTQNAVEISEVLVHRFRSTLTGVMGFADLLAMNDSLSDEGKEELDAVTTGLSAMRSLLDQLDHFRQLPNVSMASVDLHTVVQQCVLHFQQLGEKRLQFHTNLKENVVLKTDESLLQELLSCLIENAIDAIEEETDEIQVYLDKAGEIIVKNTGKLIDKDQSLKIFHPFFTTKAQSLGLGLSRAALIAEALGMYLYLKTNNQIEGVQFCLEWPKLNA
jgi:signal transduction histidine kinase